MPLLLAWLIHGLVIAALVRGALRFAGSATAATRYAVCWAGLGIVLALPLALLTPELALTQLQLFTQDASSAPVATTRVTLGDATAASATHAATPVLSKPDTPASTSPAASESPAPATRAASSGAMSAPAAPFDPAPLLRLPRIPDWVIAIAIGLWLGFVSIGLLRIAQAIDAMQRLKAASRPFPASRAGALAGWRQARRHGRLVELRLCDGVSSASFLGLTRPVIAISPALASSLTDEELDLTVMHEFAHAQRFDDWTKLAQLVVMAFCGWHPGVRLLDRAIDLERESACDDWVVRRSGSARGYARCLVKIVQTMPVAAEVLVPGAYASESAMETRVKRLLDKNCRHDAWAPFSAIATACGAAALAFVLTQVAPMRALASHAADGETAAALEAMARGAVSTAASAAADASLASSNVIPSNVPPSNVSASNGTVSGMTPVGLGSVDPGLAVSSATETEGRVQRRFATRDDSGALDVPSPAHRAPGTAGAPSATFALNRADTGTGATPTPVAFRPAVMTTAAMTPSPARLDAALLTSRVEPIAPPAPLTPALRTPVSETRSSRPADDGDRADAASTVEEEDVRGVGRATLGALGTGTRKAGSAGAAAGGGLAQAGASAGGGIADAGMATGAGFKHAGLATGQGLSQAGRATGGGLATAGVATGQATATAAQKTGSSLKKSGAQTGRALAKVRNAFKIF